MTYHTAAWQWEEGSSRQIESSTTTLLTCQPTSQQKRQITELGTMSLAQGWQTAAQPIGVVAVCLKCPTQSQAASGSGY